MQNSIKLFYKLFIWASFIFLLSAPIYAAAEKSSSDERIEINDSLENIIKIWSSLNKTQDKRYLIQLLDYLNKDFQYLFYSYELLNREFLCMSIAGLQNKEAVDTRNIISIVELSKIECQSLDDFFDDFERSEKQNFPKNLSKLEAYRAVFIMIDQGRRTSMDFDKFVRETINEHPDLDYVKKIETLIRFDN